MEGGNDIIKVSGDKVVQGRRHPLNGRDEEEHTMSVPCLDRFQYTEPPEFVVACCEHCEEEIWNYQEVVECEGSLFCDDTCLLDWFKDQTGAHLVTAGEVVKEWRQ